jgi:hypothetical protein
VACTICVACLQKVPASNKVHGCDWLLLGRLAVNLKTLGIQGLLQMELGEDDSPV